MCSGGGGGSTDPLSGVGNVIEEKIIEPIDEAYQGSDIDTTLEGVQETGEFMVDVVDTIISGEPKGDVKETQQALQETQDAYEEVGEDYQEALDNIGDAFTDTVDISMQVAEDFSDKMAEQLGVSREEQRRGADVTRGADVERDDLMLTLGKKKSDLKAAKKKGKKGLRIDYGVSLPGSGKSGIAA